jgi:DNA-binding SARP family transcriptional activator
LSGLAIYLLGKPRVERDGAVVPSPRGYKPWALLAYLLRTEGPPSRDELVSLLISKADDPFAALRWNLSALRRLLADAELAGDPLRLTLPSGTFVDVESVTSRSSTATRSLVGIERELLEGVCFPSSPAYEIWLMTERLHIAAAAEGMLREAALTRLGAGDASMAVDLAGRLVRMNPLDENFQALLVRSLAASGDGVAATAQVARCTELFRRELGVEPSPALGAAAHGGTVSATARPLSGRAAARAQLDAGEAAIAAGAVDAGLESLRRGLIDARGAGDLALQARALVSLGSALVHVARGCDEEAAAAQHEALAIARRADLASLATAASRELGTIELFQGRYERTEYWLVRAASLAGEDLAERGRIAGVLGTALSDTAHYGRAIEKLGDGLRLSREAGDRRQVAFTLAMLGRAHLLRGDIETAESVLDESLALAKENWPAFGPWPKAFRAEVNLAMGQVDRAVERFERAFALARQLDDPCWEGIAARGLGVAAAARGELHAALEWLKEARSRSVRLPDAYTGSRPTRWTHLARLRFDQRLTAASSWVEDLAALAARTRMREFAVRACVYRGRLGDESAFMAARLLAAEIDNPALSQVLPRLLGVSQAAG